MPPVSLLDSNYSKKHGASSQLIKVALGWLHIDCTAQPIWACWKDILYVLLSSEQRSQHLLGHFMVYNWVLFYFFRFVLLSLHWFFYSANWWKYKLVFLIRVFGHFENDSLKGIVHIFDSFPDAINQSLSLTMWNILFITDCVSGRPDKIRKRLEMIDTKRDKYFRKQKKNVNIKVKLWQFTFSCQ